MRYAARWWNSLFVAIVTHKGNSADSGHYIGWTRQPTEENGIPGEEDWWKFDGEPRGVDDGPLSRILVLIYVRPRLCNLAISDLADDKVSVVPVSKIMSLDGGGEDSTAYILLYRSKVV